MLDVVLIRTEGGGPLTAELPDGLDDLGLYNLISFKSFQEALDGEALDELVGFYGAYRKQVSPKPSERLPADLFRLFAICARFPQQVASEVGLTQMGEGVYQGRSFSKDVRVIVLSRLPLTPRNAALLRFSADAARWKFAERAYRPRSPFASSILRELFEAYTLEGLPMPYTLEQQIEDSKKFLLERITPEERLALVKEFPVEERLEGVPVEKRLEGVPVEKRLEGVPVERRLEGLSPEERAELLRLLTGGSPPETPKP